MPAAVTAAERVLRRPLPFAAGGGRHRVGVRQTDAAHWLETSGDDVAGQLAEKARVFDAHRSDVLAVLPGSLDACQEVLELAGDPGAEPQIAVPTGCHPLEAAGRRVPEDFCVHLPDRKTGVLTLVAGCVCFPNRWSLGDKLGLPVTAIHGPVPGYEPQLARPVDRLLDKLREGRILERANWGIVESGELYAPLRTAGRSSGWDGVAADPWLRIERQTLRRLPRTGAVVFTIRTLTAPLAVVSGDPEAATMLAEAIRELPDDVTRYKLGPPTARAAILEYLEQLNP